MKCEDTIAAYVNLIVTLFEYPDGNIAVVIIDNRGH